MPVPKRVIERIQGGLKQYCPILQSLKDRDVSEADTVTVVKDLLSDVFGYDKYTEVTGEYAIRGTYCDLAIKVEGKLEKLIEVKAIGSDLNERHVKQVIDYAANQGCDWVILTNGVEWVLYHVLFKKPIDKEEIARINLLSINTRSEGDLERLFLFTKEGVLKDALAEYRDRRDATSHYMLAALMLNSDLVLNALRKEVRQVSDILVDRGVIEKVLREQVIKREAIEGEHAQEATKRYQKKQAKVKRQQTKASATASAARETLADSETNAIVDDAAEKLLADTLTGEADCGAEPSSELN